MSADADARDMPKFTCAGVPAGGEVSTTSPTSITGLSVIDSVTAHASLCPMTSNQVKEGIKSAATRLCDSKQQRPSVESHDVTDPDCRGNGQPYALEEFTVPSTVQPFKQHYIHTALDRKTAGNDMTARERQAYHDLLREDAKEKGEMPVSYHETFALENRKTKYSLSLGTSDAAPRATSGHWSDRDSNPRGPGWVEHRSNIAPSADESDAPDLSMQEDRNSIYLYSDNLHGYSSGRTVPAKRWKATNHPSGLLAHFLSGSTVPDEGDMSLGKDAYPAWEHRDALHKYREGLTDLYGPESQCDLMQGSKVWSWEPKTPLSVEERVIMREVTEGGEMGEEEEVMLRLDVKRETPAFTVDE